MANEENEELIDRLVIVSNYKGVFDYLKDSIVNKIANEQKWNKTKIDSVKTSIKFENQPKSMYYNAYHSESREDLEIMIGVFESTESFDIKENMSFYKKMIISNYRNYITRKCQEK